MFTAKNMSHLVVSLFCFASCAWQAGQVKFNIDMMFHSGGATLCPEHQENCPSGPRSHLPPGGRTKPEDEDILAGNIASAVLFGFAGIVAFSCMFLKQS